MNPTDFCYWLQGYFELGGGKNGLTAEQVRTVQNHLSLVFHHSIDPQHPGDPQELQDIHDGVGRPPFHAGGVGPGGVVIRC